MAFSSTTFAAGPMGIQYGAPIKLENGEKKVQITDDVADKLAQSGAGWVRVNFIVSHFGSDNAEFYSKYDEMINRLRSRGLQVIGLMSNESWPGSQQQWVENNWENTGRDGYNAYIDQYCYAFQRMAKHYEGKIRFWELWNEPNAWSEHSPDYKQFWGGSFIYPSNFAALLAQCHAQVHYFNNMDIQVISAGFFGHSLGGVNYESSGAKYFDETYDIGINKTGKFAWTKGTYGTYPLDYVGQHIYLNQFSNLPILNTADFTSYLDNIRGVANKYGDGNKKTIITEFGWETSPGHVNENDQAANLTNAFNIFKSKSYLYSAIWFKLEEDPPANLHFGIFRADGSKKPAWSNFKTATTYEGLRKTSTSTSVVTKIQNYFNSKGGLKAFGSPLDNGGSVWAHQWDYGYVQDFDGGNFGKLAIFDTGYRVQLGFWKKYLEGSNHTILRFPTSDEFAYKNGVRQNFQRGYMTWDPTNQVKVCKTITTCAGM